MAKTQDKRLNFLQKTLAITGLTYKQLAKKINKSRTFVDLLISGDFEIKPEIFEKIVKVAVEEGAFCEKRKKFLLRKHEDERNLIKPIRRLNKLTAKMLAEKTNLSVARIINLENKRASLLLSDWEKIRILVDKKRFLIVD